jgi:hypothetical protein
MSSPRRADIYTYSLQNPVRYVDPDGLDARMLGSYKSEMEVSNNYRAAIEADSNWELQFSGGESSFGYEDARCTGMYGMPCDAVTERPGQPSDDGDTFTPPFVKDVKRDTERLAERTWIA